MSTTLQSSGAWHEDIVDESTTIATTEATQTTNQDDFKVMDDALAIWILAKKHRVYEQRAVLRGRQIKH